MRFGEYIKICRRKFGLTQQDLVEKLYSYDESFESLNEATLSRWERGLASPSSQKEVMIAKFFTNYSKSPFPCFESIENIDNIFCKNGVKNLIGNSKIHIVNLPEDTYETDEIVIVQLKSFENSKIAIKMMQKILKQNTQSFFEIPQERLYTWSKYPSNLFLAAVSDNQIIGMFFALYLSDKSFESVINLTKSVESLEESDFAHPSSSGNSLIISFFAFNRKIASLLYLRYYAYLISNQFKIKNVGTLSVAKEGRKLIDKINLKPVASRGKLSSFSTSLQDMILNESVFRMIFSKK
jgi:transcriptional regulator with XRE-family HTH domain